MFCPSCGARNATGARTCVECNRALPAPRPGGAPGSTTPLDVAPTIHDVPQTHADAPGSSPAQAPVQPPRILKKPAPLAPAPIDVVPRNPAPPPAASMHARPSPSPVNPEDPTVVRRQPPPAPQRQVAHSSPPPIQTGELAATRPIRPPPVTMPSNPPSAPASADVPFPSSSPPASQPSSNARPQPPPSFAAPSTQAGGETEPMLRAPRAVTNGGPANGASAASTRTAPPSALASAAPAPSVSSPELRPPSSPKPAAPLAPTVELPMPAMPPKTDPAARRSEAKPVEAKPAAPAAKDAFSPGTDVTAQAPAYQPPASVVLDVTHGLRWLASSLVDTALGAAFAFGAAAFLLQRKGVRIDVQPIVDFIHKSPPQAVVFLGGGAFIGLAIYQVLTVAILGGTVGQRVLGLRVLRLKDGARAGILRSILRGVVCAGGALFLLAGPLFGVFLDRKRRGIGDLFARTVVARRGESE